MKRVILENDVTTINIENITNDTILGVDFKRDGGKSFLIYTDDGYIGVSLMDNGKNKGEKWAEKTQKEYVKEAINIKAEVYVFQTYRDLFEWILE